MEDFQSKTFRNYKNLMLGLKKASLIEERGYATFRSSPNDGFIKKRLFRLLNDIEKWAVNYYKTIYFKDRERKVDGLINNPKIKKILCPIFKKNLKYLSSKKEIEMEVIRILTIHLTEKEIMEELSIEKDEKVFSLMAYKLLNFGLQKFCHNFR